MPCSWYGVVCEAGRVIQLSLPDNNLVDSLPSTLADLAGLHRLDLSHNLLNGPLPATLGTLPSLQQLDLSANQLTGPLPMSLDGLALLEALDLSHNTLTGALPEQLGNLAALQRLDLSFNALHGRIPVEFGGLLSLRHLDVSHNALADSTNGFLAEVLAGLGQLSHLDLSYNWLSGDLPWWPNLTGLEYLDLSHNDFTGGLPWQFTNLTQLRHVALHTNRLTGVIPPEWGQIGANVAAGPGNATPPTGIYIDLSGNHLYGSIPAELGQNPAIVGLQLSGNQLSGAVPDTLTNRAFYRLDLNYNRLTSRDDRDLDWRATQTMPPTDLRAALVEEGLILTWTPPPYSSHDGGYEISYATTPNGPFTVAAHPGDKQRDHYTLIGLGPGSTYYVRLRTITNAHTYYENGIGWDVFDHPYFQPNNLWSDYTPVVCANCEVTPANGCVFLPHVVR